AGAPEQLGADHRGRADDLERREHLRADLELARLIGLELTQQIAAERHTHTGLAGQLERAQPRRHHDLVLLEAIRPHAPAATASHPRTCARKRAAGAALRAASPAPISCPCSTPRPPACTARAIASAAYAWAHTYFLKTEASSTAARISSVVHCRLSSGS